MDGISVINCQDKNDVMYQTAATFKDIVFLYIPEQQERSVATNSGRDNSS